MAELRGTFYDVSVGPGNPELMTLQAVRLIRQCPVLAAPQTASGQMLALDIARSALGEALDGKTFVPLYFAMSLTRLRWRLRTKKQPPRCGSIWMPGRTLPC